MKCSPLTSPCPLFLCQLVLSQVNSLPLLTNEKYLSAEPALSVSLNGKSAQQNLQLGCEIVPWLKNWSLVENTGTHFVFYQ